ncbi:MAG TPA: hypothetical protein VID19_05590 [Candidatus Eremiobacteraceae bacterium]
MTSISYSGTPGDCIRIVPLTKTAAEIAVADKALAASPAQLTYRNGPMLSSVQVFTIFWGSAWASDPLRQLVAKLNAFFSYVLTSALMDQLSEYDVNGFAVGHGTLAGSATLTAADPAGTIDDSSIQSFLQTQIAAKTLPAPAANTLYFLYLPPGVVVTLGSSQSCQTFCGYHDQINGQIFYGVMPYPGCAGCLGSLADFDALTSTSSHELCEAITDPIPGQGWYDDANGEIGDICAWRTKKLGIYQVQLEWSNKNGSCS